MAPCALMARGRYQLALPGVLAGLLGYAVGNHAGGAVARRVRAGTGRADCRRL